MMFWLCAAFALYGFCQGCYWSLCDGINDALCVALQEASQWA